MAPHGRPHAFELVLRNNVTKDLSAPTILITNEGSAAKCMDDASDPSSLSHRFVIYFGVPLYTYFAL